MGGGGHRTQAAYQAAWFFKGHLWRGTVAPAAEWQAAEVTYLKYLAECPAHSKYSTTTNQKRDTFPLEQSVDTGAGA